VLRWWWMVACLLEYNVCIHHVAENGCKDHVVMTCGHGCWMLPCRTECAALHVCWHVPLEVLQFAAHMCMPGLDPLGGGAHQHHCSVSMAARRCTLQRPVPYAELPVSTLKGLHGVRCSTMPRCHAVLSPASCTVAS
jgi:hypothetical protein